MDEEWRDIPGYKNYQASDQGNIRHWVNGEWLDVRKLFGAGGGRYYSIYIRGKRSPVAISNLVAITFVGERPPGQFVRHLNDVGTDNRSCNLCYGTQVDNMADARRNGKVRIGSKHHGAKLCESDIPKIIERYASGESQTSIANSLGIVFQTVSDIIRGDSWKSVARSSDIPSARERISFHSSGPRNPNAKLNPAIARDIIAARESGIAKSITMKEFNISDATYYRIINGEHWATKEEGTYGI